MGTILYRILQTSWRLFVALILGLLAYGYVVLQKPGFMLRLMDWSNDVVVGLYPVMAWIGDFIGRSDLSEQFAVWSQVLNADDKLVFMGFVIFFRILLALIFGLLTMATVGLWRAMTKDRSGGTAGTSAAGNPNEAPPAQTPPGRTAASQETVRVEEAPAAVHTAQTPAGTFDRAEAAPPATTPAPAVAAPTLPATSPVYTTTSLPSAVSAAAFAQKPASDKSLMEKLNGVTGQPDSLAERTERAARAARKDRH